MPSLSSTPASTPPSSTLLMLLSIFFAGGFLFFHGSKSHIREHAINPVWPFTDPIFSDTLGWNSAEFERGVRRYTEELMREYTLMLIFRAPFVAVYSLFGFILVDTYLIDLIRHNFGFKFGLDIISTRLVFSVLPKFDPIMGLLGGFLFSVLGLGFLHQIYFERGISCSLAALQNALQGLFIPTLVLYAIGFLFFGWGSGRSNDSPVLRGYLYATILSLPLITAAAEVLESVSIIYLLFELPTVHPLLANLGGMLGIIKHAAMYTSVVAVLFGLIRYAWSIVSSGVSDERKTN